MLDRPVPLTKITLRMLIRAYLPVYLVLLVYYLAVLQVLGPFQTEITFDMASALPGLTMTLPPFLFLMLGLLYVRLFVLRGERTALESVRHWIAGTPWFELLVLRIPLGFAVIFALQRIFIAVKPQIPNLNPFAWDHFFIDLDRALFFGTDPWELTHALLPTGGATLFFDQIYQIWFFAMYAVAFFAVVMRHDSVERLAFLLSFALSWVIGGTILAAVFSSAGPVYVERLFGDATFVPLTDRLAAQDAIYNFPFLKTIEHLWQGQVDPEVPALGISAFPSMHLWISALIACFCYSVARWLGWVLIVFAGLILVGSVHLGWHYAVDGIGGIIGAWVLWIICLRFARWWMAEPGPLESRTSINQRARAA